MYAFMKHQHFKLQSKYNARVQYISNTEIAQHVTGFLGEKIKKNVSEQCRSKDK